MEAKAHSKGFLDRAAALKNNGKNGPKKKV